jgi:hypothetical protein
MHNRKKAGIPQNIEKNGTYRDSTHAFQCKASGVSIHYSKLRHEFPGIKPKFSNLCLSTLCSPRSSIYIPPSG